MALYTPQAGWKTEWLWLNWQATKHDERW